MASICLFLESNIDGKPFNELIEESVNRSVVTRRKSLRTQKTPATTSPTATAVSEARKRHRTAPTPASAKAMGPVTGMASPVTTATVTTSTAATAATQSYRCPPEIVCPAIVKNTIYRNVKCRTSVNYLVGSPDYIMPAEVVDLGGMYSINLLPFL